MNEKMNKLWDQVKLQECDCGCNPDEFLRLKFAELIVRECTEWIKNTDSDPDIGEEDAKALLEHFGVEE